MRIVGILFAMALAVSLVLMPAAVLAQDECTASCGLCCEDTCPTGVSGTGGVANCEWDPYPKWWDNAPSHDLYLNHWGRTPIQAMSRLAGLCSPDILCREGQAGTPLRPIDTNCPGDPIYGDPNSCWQGGCPAARSEEGCCLACCACGADTCDECKPVPPCEIMGDASCVSTSTPTTPVPCACNDVPVFTNELPHCGGCWGVSLAFANKSWAAATIGPQASLNDNHLNHFGTSCCYGGNHGGDWGLSGCPHTECCSLTWCLQDNCFASGNCN